MILAINRSDEYKDISVSAPYNKAYVTIDTSDWIDKPWMFYELPSLKFEIYTETNGELLKYRNFTREIRTYNPVYSPLGVLNVTIDIRNVPEEFILRITPIFDNGAVAARNMLIENGIEYGDIWGKDQDVPTQLFNLNIEFIECSGNGSTHEETITGVPPITFDGSTGEPLVSWTILGNGSQTGTPTPDAPIMPEFVGVRTANLFDGSISETSRYLSSDGEINSSSAFNVSDYIPCDAETTYTIEKVNTDSVTPSVCFYSSQKDFLGGVNYNRNSGITFSTPADCAYLKVSYRKNMASEAMLNLGSTALPYEPYGWAEKITNAGQTSTVYLGQTQTVRRVRKLVLDGTENITSSHTDIGLFNIPVTDYLKLVNSILHICSHYPAGMSVNSWSEVTDLTCRFYGNSTNPSKLLYIRDSSFSTVEDFKAYLAAQYSAGTPVTIWYVLANEQTGIVNEPLCKIGTYADELHSEDAGVSIPTAKGSNTLTVDTVLQPSEMTITYMKEGQ